MPENQLNKKILVTVILMVFFNNSFLLYGHIQNQIDLPTLVKSLNLKYKISNVNSKKLIFMLRYIDFGCQVCLKNFFELCDSLNRLNDKQFHVSVYLIFLEEENYHKDQHTAMEEWVKSCGLVYPVAILNNDFFKKFGIEHSSLIILGENGDIIQKGEIPFNWLSLKNILMDKK